MRQGQSLFLLTMLVAMTIWNCVDGGQSIVVTVAACVGTVSVVRILDILAVALPRTRLMAAIFSASWVVIFLPIWDWLSGQFVLPDSLWSGLLFGLTFGLLRYSFPTGGSSRPPS